jgi:hypothetical protein
MKKFTFIVLFSLLFISIKCSAQDFKDLLIKQNGDTIRCKVTFANENNIFYDFLKKKNRLEHAMISQSEIKSIILANPNSSILSDDIKKSGITNINDSSQLSVNNTKIKKSEIFNEINLAGKSLQKFTKRYYIGMAIVIVGVGVSICSIPTGIIALAYIGSAGAIVGTLSTLTAISQIGTAGNHLINFSTLIDKVE